METFESWGDGLNLQGRRLCSVPACDSSWEKNVEEAEPVLPRSGGAYAEGETAQL